MRNRLALLVTLALVGGGVIAGSAFAALPAKGQIVTVILTDYKIKFVTSAPIKHGVPIVFKTVNKGNAPHNVDFQGVKASKVITGGQTASVTITFKKAGKYPYVCAVPRHAELGMGGTLTVR